MLFRSIRSMVRRTQANACHGTQRHFARLTARGCVPSSSSIKHPVAIDTGLHAAEARSTTASVLRRRNATPFVNQWWVFPVYQIFDRVGASFALSAQRRSTFVSSRPGRATAGSISTVPACGTIWQVCSCVKKRESSLRNSHNGVSSSPNMPRSEHLSSQVRRS